MGIRRLPEFWPEWKANEVLGEGSYGKVYKTIKNEGGLHFESAVKVISIPNNTGELRSLYSEGMSDFQAKTYLGGIVTDFITEIKLMENLKTAANIVTVEDYKVLEKKGEIGWDIYIRMELLKPFDRVMSEKKFTENEVAKLGIDICTALEACARHRVIHRDIKPANIFLNNFGDYKIGDFGIAKELEKTTGTMSSKGTYSYMAPEVAHGLKYDSTVDIYSLGIVMYVLLNNNRQPFTDPYSPQISYNEKKSAVDKRLSGQALPKPCNASDELSSIILTACNFDPRKRYQSASALKNALNYYISRRIVSAPESIHQKAFIDRSFEKREAVVQEKVQQNPKKPELPKQESLGAKNKEVDNLLERVFMFLEDGDWQSAAKYCERVLDSDPRNARAYLGRLMISLGVRSVSGLGKLLIPFDANMNYKKIMQFGDERLKKVVRDYNKNVLYNSAVKHYEKGDLVGAAILFKRISGYYDADRYYIEINEMLEVRNRENEEQLELKCGKKAIKKVESRIYRYVFGTALMLGIALILYFIYHGILFVGMGGFSDFAIALSIASLMTAVMFLILCIGSLRERLDLVKNYNRNMDVSDDIKEYLLSSGLIMISDKSYYVNGLGTYVCGFMRGDLISVGDSVSVQGKRYSVHDIESQVKELTEARRGDYVAFLISADNLGLPNEIPIFNTK